MTIRTPVRALLRAGPLLETPTEMPAPTSSGLHREAIEFEPTLRLRLTYPSRDVVVLTATGEVDTATAPRVAALLWPRLLTKLSTVVLDLSGVTFLGVAGLELIIAALAYASHRDVEFIVAGGSTAVERALRAGGLDRPSPAPRGV
ncbi:STAS domain-containing protein [Saccharopolyspora sp. ASAGF58]|uniref:STAS domain-containing protein n=1 Tax=Saccharopolyspora sp. ASAGF58 TaxID=2719023 RepID=UPI00143FF900|nr:STAS domain-containing protein [Saccharopolyspora sp. ASAGF58]QIZ35418.1 STAS domain-containing protein [Saccharopolyspora sp. ASAGF58]